jgi:hypothetical protein
MSESHESDPDVIERAKQARRDRHRGPVIFTKTVYRIKKNANGTLTPRLIKTMADYDKWFAPAGHTSVEEALRDR